jgi:acyl-CoA thioester hydrolase
VSLQAAEGAWSDGTFCFPIRVYYEDTDVGGMVYHARYVSFFERVRTESIRSTAADVDVLFGMPDAEGGPRTYVVSKLNVAYHAQAKIGDLLMGYSRVKRVRAAAIEVEQWIERDGLRIASAELVVAIIDNAGKPSRWPLDAKAQWTKWMQEAAENDD